MESSVRKKLIVFFLSKVEVNTSKVLRSPPRLVWPLWNICVTNDHGYFPLVANTSRSFPRSWLITEVVTILTRRITLVEQKLFTLPKHLSSPPVFSGVRVSRSLVLCVYFVDCVVCSSSIYGFWLPIWYVKSLLTSNRIKLKSRKYEFLKTN